MKKTISIGIFILFMVCSYAKNMDESIIITFTGNQQIETASLEAVIGVSRPSALAFWQKDIATINALYIPKLDEIFRLYYKKEGFYDANITHKIDKKGIHFFIEEHRFIKISNVEIESDFEIEDVVLLEKGTRFRAKAFGETKESIKKKLLKEGLCSYKLNTKAFIDLEKQSAKIVIKLQKGKVCHFGKITIDGTPNIADDVILSRLHFKEKEPFNLYKIKESYESLYALEAFEKLHMVYDTKFSRTIPVDIKFHEIEQRHHSRIGVGYATDLEFQAKYHWEYKNFLGGARKLLFDVLYSKKQKRLQNTFFYPAPVTLWGYHLDFQNSIGYSEETNIHDFDEKVIYNKTYLQHREDKWLHSVGLGIENRDISNDKNFFLIYPFIQIIYDLRDSKVNPEKGLYFSHEMEYGLPYTPDSTTYLKYIEELRVIYTVDKVTLSTVGRVGGIRLFDNRVPESKKFFAGGAFSNRAYGYDRIGITTSSKTTLPNSGGSSMVNLSFEANFPFYKDFYLGLFSDNTIISENEDFWELSNSMIHSAGFGFRYLTPIGPFKFDFGFNLNKYSENGLHFQIGQSF